MALFAWLVGFADGQQAQITTTPSPAVSNKALEVKISTQDLGSEVYCYTWCKEVNGVEKTPQWSWDGVNTEKFRMTGNNGSYTLRIADIKEFYSLTEQDLEGLSKLGFIAKNRYGGQTVDLFVDVVQGRRDAYSGGEGTEDAPFILKTSADLLALASTPADWGMDCHFRMDADIDASGMSGCIGSKNNPFSATFDGNGHSISKLRLSQTAIGAATGLFGIVKDGKISNLGVVGAEVTGTNYVGILVGDFESGVIDRCYTTGIVSGSSICAGGLVGVNVGGEISNCYSGAHVSNPDDYATGGLAGKNQGTIVNGYSSGAVNGYDYVGGLVGANYGTIKNSVALNESVTCYNDFAARFGGNNNSRNFSRDNFSWDEIKPGHREWTLHGDHAVTQYASDLSNFEKFKSLTGWDFNTIWEWRKEDDREYPVLRNITGQHCTLPELYFQISTQVNRVEEWDDMLSAGPNPAEDHLSVHSESGISSFALYGVNGHIVAKGQGSGDKEVVIDLDGIGAGLYLLHVSTVNGNGKTFKIIKK